MGKIFKRLMATGIHSGVGSLEDGSRGEVSDGFPGGIGNSHRVIDGLDAGNLCALFLLGHGGGGQGFFQPIRTHFLGFYGEPALLAVEDVSSDGLSKYFLVSVGVQVVIGYS